MLLTVASGRLSEIWWTRNGKVTHVDTEIEEDGEIRTYPMGLGRLLDKLFGKPKVHPDQRVKYVPWA